MSDQPDIEPQPRKEGEELCPAKDTEVSAICNAAPSSDPKDAAYAGIWKDAPVPLGCNYETLVVEDAITPTPLTNAAYVKFTGYIERAESERDTALAERDAEKQGHQNCRDAIDAGVHANRLKFGLLEAEIDTLKKELDEAKNENTRLDTLLFDLNERHLQLARGLAKTIEERDMFASAPVRVRCLKHLDIPQQNANEASGSECGGCIAAELTALRAAVEKIREALGWEEPEYARSQALAALPPQQPDPAL